MKNKNKGNSILLIFFMVAFIIIGAILGFVIATSDDSIEDDFVENINEEKDIIIFEEEKNIY